MMINLKLHIEKKKNFGLSKIEFDQVVIKLKEGNEDLFEKIFLSHCPSCIQYLNTHLNIPYHKSYDATMETLIAFRKKILIGQFKYGNLRYLFTRMAKFYALKEKEQIKEFSVSEIGIFERPESKQSEVEDALINQLMDSLDLLNHAQRQLVDLHYYQGLKLIQIADILGEKEGTVRKRKQRIISFLKKEVRYDEY